MNFKIWLEQGTKKSGSFSLKAGGRASQKQYTPETPISLIKKKSPVGKVPDSKINLDLKPIKPDEKFKLKFKVLSKLTDLKLK